MTHVRLVPLLLLLAPGAVLAQAPALDAPTPTPPPLIEVAEETSPSAPSTAEEGTPLRVTSPGPTPERPTLLEPTRPGAPPTPLPARLFLESLSGGLCGGAGALVGLVSAVLLEPQLGIGCHGDVCSFDDTPTVGLTMMGLSLGAATGVYLSGTWMEARGGVLPTFVGALLGGAASTGLYAAGVGRSEASGIFLLALPLASAVTAFEVSSASAPPSPRALSARREGPRLVPTVGVTSRGGALGLAGRF